jgi:hypothetical protein
MTQYRISFQDVTRVPDRDVYALTMAVSCDEEYLGLYSTELEGRVFRLRTFCGTPIEMGVKWAWVRAMASVIEDSVRHGEAPRAWSSEVRPLALDPAAVIHAAGELVMSVRPGEVLDLPAIEGAEHRFDCFTPDRNRWEFRSGRGKKRCSIDLRRGVRLLSDEVRHADMTGATERPAFVSPWSRPGVITLV